MKFHNETTYDRKAVAALNRAATRADRRWKSLLFRGLGALWAVLLLISASYLGPNIVGILDAGLAVIVMIWVLFLNQIRAWIVTRIMKDNNRFSAEFRENGYTLTGGGETLEFPYDEVYAVYEDRNYFFFMQDKHQGHVFSKAGFRDGNAEEFRTFLEKNLSCGVRSV